jgi:hypothetical protein
VKHPSKFFQRSVLLGLILVGLAACAGDALKSGELEQSALVETGTYILTVRHSGMVLDVPNANPQAGIQLQQADRNNGNAQKFRIEAVDSKHVKIISLLNGYALTADLPKEGGKVSLQPYSNTSSKQWLLLPKTGGFYEIANRASRGLLDVAAAATYAGGRVQTWSRAGVDNQRWTLEKVGGTVTPPTSNYQQNLTLIKNAGVRNRNHDNSPYRNTPLNSLPTGDSSPLLGPRSEYIVKFGDNSEQDFPEDQQNVGTFRTACEFSHFAYDDPLVHPGKPGAAHLHMFWGNTDVNAYSTYNTLKDTGSSTCNGMELNRTGYWAPAMFDAKGNVRIPERIIVYYKGNGLANGTAEVYPAGAAMVIDDKVVRTSNTQGGTQYNEPNPNWREPQMSFLCTDGSRGIPRVPMGLTIPVCQDKHRPTSDYTAPLNSVLEMHVKFPNCWNGQNPADPKNWLLASSGVWFYSNCVADGNRTLPNLQYIIAYPLEPGETTAGWYLSSDVNPTTRQRTKTGGTSVHADWWGAWNLSINREWINNCVNDTRPVAKGCGFGYLSDGGPKGTNLETPYPGRALKFRPQYTGDMKVAATTLYRELCPGGPAISTATAAAYCRPAPMNITMSGGTEMNNFSHDHH